MTFFRFKSANALCCAAALLAITQNAFAQPKIEITISPATNGVHVAYRMPQVCISAPFLDSRATVARFFRARWERTEGCLSPRGGDLVADSGPCRNASFFVPNDTEPFQSHYTQSQSTGAHSQLFYPAYLLLGTSCAPTSVTLQPAPGGSVQLLGSAQASDGPLTIAPEKIDSAYVLFTSQANAAALRSQQHLIDERLPSWLRDEVKRADETTRAWMRSEFGALSEHIHLVANRNDADNQYSARMMQHGDVADPRAIRLTFYKPSATPSAEATERAQTFIAHELGHVLQPAGLPRLVGEGSAELFALLAQLSLGRSTLDANLSKVNEAIARCFIQLPEQNQRAADRRDPYACGLTALALAALQREGPERGARALLRALAGEWKPGEANKSAMPSGPATAQLESAVASITSLSQAVSAFEKRKGVTLRKATRAQIDGERGWFWAIAPMLRTDCDGADFLGLDTTIEVGDNARCRTIPARYKLSSVDGLPIATAAARIIAGVTTRCEGNKPSAPITLSDGAREVKIETDCVQFGVRSIPELSAESGLFESKGK
jgi:hypothetical protein